MVAARAANALSLPVLYLRIKSAHIIQLPSVVHFPQSCTKHRPRAGLHERLAETGELLTAERLCHPDLAGRQHEQVGLQRASEHLARRQNLQSASLIRPESSGEPRSKCACEAKCAIEVPGQDA